MSASWIFSSNALHCYARQSRTSPIRSQLQDQQSFEMNRSTESAQSDPFESNTIRLNLLKVIHLIGSECQSAHAASL